MLSLPFIVWQWKCWCCWWDLCIISDAIFCNSCSLTPNTTSWIDPNAIRIQWQCRELSHCSNCVITYNWIRIVVTFVKIWTNCVYFVPIPQENKTISICNCEYNPVGAKENGNNRFFIVHNRLIMTLGKKNLRHNTDTFSLIHLLHCSVLCYTL